MSTNGTILEQSRTTSWVIGIVGTFLLVGFLVWVMYSYVRPANLAAARTAERYQFLAEVQATETILADEYGWVNQERGFVRLPLVRAVEITLEEWQDPAAARALLATRVEELTAPAPEPENIYE